MNWRFKMFGLVTVLAGIVAFPLMPAEARPIRVGVTAIGSGTDSDKNAAMSGAKENARGMLVCAGRLEDVDVSSTGCVKLGSDESPNYMCSAVARATCVIGS